MASKTINVEPVGVSLLKTLSRSGLTLPFSVLANLNLLSKARLSVKDWLGRSIELSRYKST
jgi:hypothetical protein